ncbi:MAG: CDGSH iron-sulfur domain-containing protein [Saprospirales bacterium]|nr:MAG: CDGSH iron-sulfur domain-containing protein [Saprospirales bacterium]
MANLNLVKDGPIQVKGSFDLKGPDGNPIDCKEQIFLCRCGATNNKPFCDGSHSKSGFSD